MSLKKYLVAVDVGTDRVTAALVSTSGEVIRKCIEPILTWNPEPGFYEQSSGNIWEVVCFCVKTVTAEAQKENIIGIAYDANGSLVIYGENAEPLAVSKSNIRNRNIMLWMDSRAKAEADTINETNHDMLKYVGGSVGPEMEMPKLLWLKNNVYETTYSKLWRAFDLVDFLTWRSTERDTRSLCCLCCRWNFDGANMSWNLPFLKQIGLEELSRNGFETIGKVFYFPGQSIGAGLCQRSAAELNLLPGIAVASSLIQSYAGTLGMISCTLENQLSCLCDVRTKLALVCGSTTFHLSLTKEPCEAEGISGPFKNVLLSDYYVNECGQSATGSLLGHVVKTHPRYAQIESKLGKNENVFTYLNNMLTQMAAERQLDDICYLTKGLHVVPDYLGNRSPICDHTMRGMICGLDMSDDENSLAILYLAHVQALAYGTRHIIESMLRCKRINFEALLFCGGLSKNRVYLQSHADICGLPVIIPNDKDVVLRGTAMVGACAAKVHSSLEIAAKAMADKGTVLNANDTTEDFHGRKYGIFIRMIKDQQHYKEIEG